MALIFHPASMIDWNHRNRFMGQRHWQMKQFIINYFTTMISPEIIIAHLSQLKSGINKSEITYRFY